MASSEAPLGGSHERLTGCRRELQVSAPQIQQHKKILSPSYRRRERFESVACADEAVQDWGVFSLVASNACARVSLVRPPHPPAAQSLMNFPA